MENYVNISDYTKKKFGTVDYDTDHILKYSSIVKDLNYESCKNILLAFATIDELKKKYKEDKHFNGRFFNTNDTLDIWGDIGKLMTTNPNRKITVERYPLYNLTCIAKQCARMIVMEDLKNEKIHKTRNESY